MAQKPEEKMDEVKGEVYEPAPRGAARVAGVDLAAIDARLKECAEFFTKHCDEADYRNLDWYQWRMQLRFAAGDDVYEVVDDAFMAARCLHERHAMHLELKPPEMFMTRRIMPVELGIISGMPMLTLEFSATYGLPLMMVLGGTAPEDLMSEANLMTSYFRRGFCADFAELTGLSAVIYAGVIAAIGRGFDDEATLGINTYAKARDSLRGMPPASLLPKIKRYDALITALACLCAGNIEMIGDVLAPEAEAFEADQRRRGGEAYLSPSKMPVPKYFDTAILTILALIVLRGETIVLPETGAIAAYRDFVRGLTEIPERRIEVPGLDEESRRILQEAGIDPDNIGGNEADKSFRDAKEESEARAAAIFEEKQRLAQEAVREKIARGIAEEEKHTSVAPQIVEQESLRLSDEDESGESRSRRYDNFFDSGDDNEAQRRFNEESEAPSDAEQKSYANFFDSGDDDRPASDDAGDDARNGQSPGKDFSQFFSGGDDDVERIQAVNAKEDAIEGAVGATKDFSAFFAQDDKTDESIRAHVDEETAATRETGKSYASFFDNLDEAAIPKFDDGSDDMADDARATTSYSADFFSDDKVPLSGLKMTLDPEPEPEPKVADAKPEPPREAYVPTIEDNSPRRDFTQLFDESVPAPTIGLKMSEDAEENAKCYEKAAEHDKSNEAFSDGAEAYDADGDAGKGRDFTQLFDESVPAPTIGLKMSEDAEENAKCYEKAAEHDKSNEAFSDGAEAYDADGDAGKGRDFKRFFDDEAPAGMPTIDDATRDRDDQIRELEREQREKAQRAIEEREKRALKLKLDGTEEPELKKPESYQQRMERLIAEKHQAAKEQALREREEAMRELEAWKQSEPKAIVIEKLQLTPDAPRDPDEVVKKVDPEDLVIKGFAYDDLDMIHSNTAQKDDVEEDFDLYAAMARKESEQNSDNKDKSEDNSQ